MDRGEKFEKNATATPRQSGYLETARAMYEYAYYKDEELAHAVSVERSWDCSVACRRRWERFPFCRRPSICVSRARLWWVRGERVMEYIILGVACFVVIVLPFLRWLQLSTSVKAKSA